MGKLAKRALKRAEGGRVRTASSTGSRGPAPKAHKLVGEFRDPGERAGGLPWLVPYGANPKNIDRSLGARRQRDPNEDLPGNWYGNVTASMADGGSVIDDLRESIEMHGAADVSPEKRAENLKTTAYDVASSLPVVGNAISGKEAVESGRRAIDAGRSGNLKRALVEAGLTGLNTAGAVMGLPWGRGASQAAQDGASTARIFAGPTAKTADHAALARAQEMAAAGADRADIWRDTGWFAGPDGKWRFEIDDSGARLTGTVGPTLDKTLEHRALYDAYPDLRNVEAERGFSSGKAHISPGDAVSGVPDRMVLGNRARDDTALHEAQHLVQLREGMTPGGSMIAAYPLDGKGGAWPIYRERIKKMTTPISAEEYARVAGFDGDLAAAAPSYAEYVKQTEKAARSGVEPRLDRIAQESAAQDWYMRLAGETEARNVQARRTMAAPERQATPPWETQDVPDDMQIVRPPHEGYGQQDVMIPAPDATVNELARDLRAQGVSNESVHRNTRTKQPGRFFGPDGSLRTEVDDRGIALKRQFQPGDQAPMGDVIDHPSLFGQRPELREIPVEFTSKKTTEANQPGRLFGVARSAPSGNLEMTAGMPDDFYKEQGAKLLQYRVAEDAKWPAAVRHNSRDMLADYDRALQMAEAILKDPRPGEDVGAVLQYLERLRPLRDRLASQDFDTHKKAAKDAQRYTSGNVDGRQVRARALHTPEQRRAAGPYPYGQNMKHVGSQFQRGQIIPQPNATREDFAKMLDDAQTYGMFSFGYANGGRTRRVQRALKRAGSVTVGAVKGKTGGRDDALQVSVPAGAYVVPADVVAALGGGNSAAGLAKLEKQFKPSARRYARGGAVPIQISDGEFVVDPAAVAALGGGDASHGHDILDAFVLSTRKEYADHLNNLPGPNQ
jgi:hypothetical protein